MPIQRTTAARESSAATPKSPSLAAWAKQNTALFAKTDGRDRLSDLQSMARTVQAEQSSHFDSGKKLLQLTRAATPKQAEVIHALIHHRLNGGEYKPPAGQAPFARQVKKEIDGVGGGVDLKGLGKLALAQQYRTNLSPAGAELLDRIRSGTPAQLEVLNKQFSERLDSSAARHAWAPRIS